MIESIAFLMKICLIIFTSLHPYFIKLHNALIPRSHLPVLVKKSSETCPDNFVTGQTTANVIEELDRIVHPILDKRYGPLCGGEGWTRVVHLNVTDKNRQCPSNWSFISTLCVKKPPHTDRYCIGSSHHHTHMKRGVIKSWRVTTDEQKINK